MKARHLGISEHWLSTCAALLMAADRRTMRDVHERAETKEDDEHMQHPFTLEWSNAFSKSCNYDYDGTRNPQKTQIPNDTPERQLLAAQQNDRTCFESQWLKTFIRPEINKAGGQNKRVDAKNKNNKANTKLWQQTGCRLNDGGVLSAR